MLKISCLAPLLLLPLIACGPTLGTTQGGEDSEFEDTTDQEPPLIEHVPVEEAQLMGTDVTISAVVTDEESGVFSVKLYYKNETAGSGDWQSKNMALMGEDEWVAVIPGDEQASGGMNYYIAALDLVQNSAASPDDGAGDPWHFRLYE